MKLKNKRQKSLSSVSSLKNIPKINAEKTPTLSIIKEVK